MAASTLRCRKEKIEENVATLPGLDGRKMSKSYNNTIPLFGNVTTARGVSLVADSKKQLRDAVNSIKTDSTPPGVPKIAKGSALYALYRAIATTDETADFEEALASGLSWGEAKTRVFQKIDWELSAKRDKYFEYFTNPESVEYLLREGAAKARLIAASRIQLLREVVGLRSLTAHIGRRTFEQKPKAEKAVAEFRVWKERKDGKFYFRLVDRKGISRLISNAFDTREDALAAYKTLLTFAGPETAESLMLSTVKVNNREWLFAFRFEPDGSILASGPSQDSADEATNAGIIFLEEILKPLQGIPSRLDPELSSGN